MLEQVDVYYEGWGERWLWGTLVSTTAITGRPQIVFAFCEGPGGYHQMDVMGEALAINREAMLSLASEAEVPVDTARGIIDRVCKAASQFAAIAQNMYPHVITQDTLHTIQDRIDENVDLLR